MKRIAVIGCILAMIIILSGCGSKKSADIAGSTASAPNVNNTRDMSLSQNSNTVGKGNEAIKADSAATSQTQNNSDKKIIKYCTLLIQEEDLTKLSDWVQKKVNDMGGYIESENITEDRLTTVVRIPSDKFDDFLSYTEKGYDVKNKNITTDNITDVYIDNDARLKNLRAQEEQMLTILKKANTVEEVLKVQAELYRIRGDAEALEAKKKSWDRQVDYSSITITADKKVIVPDSKKSIIGGSEFLKAIGKGFSNTSLAIVLFLENVLIFIISNILIILVIGAAAFFGYRWYRKNGKMNL